MCRVCECYRGEIVVMDVIWRKYDLRKGDLYVLSWARVLMCGGGVRSILLLTLVARCLETI